VHEARVLLAELRGERLALGVEDVADDDLRTLLDEEARVRGAHASCRPADEGDLAADPSHGVSFRWGRQHGCRPPVPRRYRAGAACGRGLTAVARGGPGDRAG